MRLSALIGVLLLINVLPAQQIRWEKSVDYSQIPWIDSQSNVIQAHNKSLLRPFFLKLNAASKRRVNILHIGDSHVQADIFTNQTRTLMGNTFGYAGRGIVFPYTTAKTHTAADYRSYHTGKWLYAKNVEKSPELPLGVSGVSSKTFDKDAQFKFIFKQGIIQPEFTKLKILCKRTENSFDLRLITNGETVNIDVFKESKDTLSDELTVFLRSGYNDYLFEFVKNDSLQEEFEIYGLSIESENNSGVMYTSVGINGAGHYAIMRENKLPDHLQLLKPDAIILDVGANDFYQKGLDKVVFTENLISLIELFKEFAPNALIILSNSQDIYRGGYSLATCANFSVIVSEVAKSEKVAFYDWYRVAGGYKSMRLWKSYSLANKDGVHLSKAGYDLKGSLIYQAFNQTHKRLFDKYDSSYQIIVPYADTQYVQIDTTKPKIKPTVDYHWVNHKVRSGETVWTIADKYGVSTIQIKKWNRLRSYGLKRGKVLKIYTQIEQSPKIIVHSTPSVVVKNKTIKQKGTARKFKSHTVKNGETLYSISKKYQMSVDSLKKLNNLRGNTIKKGQKLKVE
jgi:LysM repeat protein